jgi:hypothetical protein
MSIYFAARFSRRYECQGYRADLLRAGHTVTSRWIDLREEVESHARIPVHIFPRSPRSARRACYVTHNDRRGLGCVGGGSRVRM